MKKEIVTGTGIQGINVSFSIQECVVMKGFQQMLKESLTEKDLRHNQDLIESAINFFDKILEGSEISGLFEAHQGLFGKNVAENEL